MTGFLLPRTGGCRLQGRLGNPWAPSDSQASEQGQDSLELPGTQDASGRKRCTVAVPLASVHGGLSTSPSFSVGKLGNRRAGEAELRNNFWLNVHLVAKTPANRREITTFLVDLLENEDRTLNQRLNYEVYLHVRIHETVVLARGN